MRIQEIVFQGLYEATSPVKIRAEKDVDSITLPHPLRAEQIQDILLSIFYPDRTPAKLALEYRNGGMVACSFRFRGKPFRILRKGGPESLRLQSGEGGNFQDVAQGKNVESILKQSMGLPEFQVFWVLSLWRYDTSPASNSKIDLDAFEPHVRDIVLRYRQARKIEAAEDRIKSLESRIAEKRRDLGKGMALEEKLGKAREKMREIEVSELSPEDVDLLQNSEFTFKEFQAQIDRLSREEEEERSRAFALLPTPFAKEPVFLVGLVVGLLAVAVSVAMSQTPWRAIALADSVGFGMCAYVLLNYYVGLERANVHQVRMESIKRRLNQVREEKVALEERINHILIHARIEDAKDVGERVEKAQKLRKIIEQMEAQVQDLRRDPAYVKGKTEIDKLEKELEVARDAKPPSSPDMMSAYQLESDLDSLGIDAAAVAQEDSEDAKDDFDPLTNLVEVAKLTQEWQGGQIVEKTRRMWAKIASFLLGERFKDVDLTADGELKVGALGAEQLAMWAKTRPSEHQALMVALLVALQVNAPEFSSRGFFESIVVPDPGRWLTADQTKKINEVFASAARRTPVILLKEP